GVVLITALWLRAENRAETARIARKEADDKREAAEKAQARAEEAEANLALDQGLALCEQGEVGRGLLWMVRSLECAKRGRADYLDRAVRVNLAAWSRELPTYGPTFRHAGGVVTLAYSPDGQMLASAGRDGFVRFWNVATGAELGAPLEHPRSAPLAGR